MGEASAPFHFAPGAGHSASGILFWGLGTGLVFAFAGWLYNRLSAGTPRAPASIRAAAQHG